MNQSVRKYGAFLLILIVITGVCFLFSYRKSGMFIDEIYTYGLSNSHYAPFLRDVAGGSLEDQVLTRQQLWDYVSVSEGERFDFGSVYYNQVNDVHPPLYYWLFHIASSLTPGVFSKWTGLILDYIIYMLAILLLYKLVMRLFGSRFNAAAAAALYGLSVIGLSTMIMIRMYVLLTALTLLLAYIVALLMERPRGFLYPLAGLTVFLGLMTQYYYVFYAFFLCAAYVLHALVKRNYRDMLLFSVWAFAGVGCLLLAFPACLDQLFSDGIVSGGSALENLKAVSQYPSRLMYYFREVRHGMKAAVYTTLLLIPALALSGKKLLAAAREKRLRADALLIILPAFLAFALVSVISPVCDQRYVYNLIPIFILAVSFLIYLLEESLAGFRREELIKNAALLLVLALALWEARCVPPQYLYPEYREYSAIAEQHSASPCVYMTDDYFAPVTQDLLQLMYFDSFFMTGDPDSEKLDHYLASFGDAKECVVYIDVSAFWSSGFVPEEMLPRLIASTGFTDYALLYANQLSVTYLLT